MVITQKIEVGISSNFVHSIRTSICIRKCNKNFGWFWSHFLEKSMGYSTRYVSEFWHFLKMAITWKIEVGIGSNFLHSIRTFVPARPWLDLKINLNFIFNWHSALITTDLCNIHHLMYSIILCVCFYVQWL